MGSSRYLIETKDAYEWCQWKWAVRITDTTTGKVVYATAADFDTEASALGYARWQVTNLERENASHWRAHRDR